MARMNKYDKMVKEYLERFPEDRLEYEPGTLAWSLMLGLPPEECINMYPECDMDEETLDLYDGLEQAFAKAQMEVR